MKKIVSLKALFAAVSALALFTAAIPAGADAESRFRKEFTESYRQMRFDYLATLIKRNKEAVPGEVRALMKEALAAKTYEEKMDLLDTANTMASMYAHWHNDDTLLREVEPVLKAEIKKEEARQAEIRKWEKYESFPGNLVMKAGLREMGAKGLKPVIFPHWVHRLLYECKACHDGVFAAQRGANSISQKRIEEGAQCGLCHNGSVSFSAREGCERCHIAGLASEERLRDPGGYGLDSIEESSRRAGARFEAGKLPGGLPLDRFKNIDWASLRRSGAWAPARSVPGKEGEDRRRDNFIAFEPKIPYIKAVYFSHGSHSSQVDCATCHPGIFREALGTTKVNTAEMSEGRACGACHGKVAFKQADCNRCHTGETPGLNNVLKRDVK